MSPLERRCRWLLLAYPAGYRRAHGEEILGTLLEATPQGRKRPYVRDIRALLVAGIRARAAENGRMTTAANLRLAVLLGIVLYLEPVAVSDAEDFAQTTGRTSGLYTGPHGVPALLAALLLAATIILVWVRRRPILIGAATAAVGAVAYSGLFQGELSDSQFSAGMDVGVVTTQLLCLAALMVLASWNERRAWGWLWMTVAIVAVFTLPFFFQTLVHQPHIGLFLILGLLVVLAAWTVTDARPLVAVCTYYLIASMPMMLGGAIAGVGGWFYDPVVWIFAVITGLAVWRLSRQSVLRTKRGAS
ncbi:MAG TPA: hypothetical protein VEV61_05275 [Streptosporangiaceae bacterium]|nr:hypothetical protein [Streptosporangiaceae bacterium]